MVRPNLSRGYTKVGGKTTVIAAELQVQAVLKLMIFPRLENDLQPIIIAMIFLYLTCRRTVKTSIAVWVFQACLSDSLAFSLNDVRAVLAANLVFGVYFYIQRCCFTLPHPTDSLCLTQTALCTHTQQQMSPLRGL